MKKIGVLLILSVFITSCGEAVKPDDNSSDANKTADSGVQNDGAAAGGIGAGGGIGGTSLEGGKLVSYEKGAINDPNNVLFEKLVYFSFDSNTVDDEYIESVKHHGRYLSFNAGASVRLEGHADELGAREYNVALGERRAISVKQIMLYEGASNDQITVISYGEEKPIEFGHDEESMSLNRRVEIVY